MDAKSDQEGFIVVYPEGSGPKVGGKTIGSWNAGRCCPTAMRENIDDVGFISLLIDELETNFNIDPDRVYVTGHSNGAQMAFRLACELSDRIAAIAPAGATGVFDSCAPSRPVPVIYFFGTADPCVPYGGGTAGGCFQKVINELLGTEGEPYTWQSDSVKAYTEKWVKWNGASGGPKITYQNKNATCLTWGENSDGDVTLCTIEGMGHVWPGGTYGDPCKFEASRTCKLYKETLGPLSSDIIANDAMWEFFKKHPRTTTTQPTQPANGVSKPPGTTMESSFEPGKYTREVPGWSNRPYDFYIPSQYDSSKKWPAVLVLHGGGGNRINQQQMTCPKGNLQDPACLHNLASREGFIVVYPSGTANPLLIRLGKEVRTWNAGGGKNGYSRVSDYAVRQGVDDIGYFNALLDDLEKAASVDKSRIYATGISNGGAMSYRLACQLSNRIAAIAPVAGADQFSAVEQCSPSRPIPIIHFHGLEDRGWPFNGGKSIVADDQTGIMAPVPETIKKWTERNGCAAAPLKGEIPDKAGDGTSVMWERYGQCRNGAEVVLYKINGGGHTWPNGWEYWEDTIFELVKDRFGKITHNISANDLMWEFFKKHSIK
jgi:polyhydroxybutyrate depolymerase